MEGYNYDIYCTKWEAEFFGLKIEDFEEFKGWKKRICNTLPDLLSLLLLILFFNLIFDSKAAKFIQSENEAAFILPLFQYYT